MEAEHDIFGSRDLDDERRQFEALDRWRALLATLSLHAPAGRTRCDAVASLRSVAERAPHLVAPYACDVAELLDAEERRVRWEAIGVLALLAEAHPAAVAPTVEIVSTVLYQQESPAMRRLALHILDAVSAASEEARDQVWPLLDEALLLLRGEAEYPAVLASVVFMCAAGVEDTEHLMEFAVQDASDRRARVRVLASRLRELLAER
jgi:hypothetical protein